MYADDLFLCGELEGLREMMERFVEVCRKRGMSNMMVLNREDRLECEVSLDGVRFEHVPEFKCLRYSCY